MALPDTDKLTWGLELEFCVALLLDGSKDPDAGHRVSPLKCSAGIENDNAAIGNLYEDVLRRICLTVNKAFHQGGITQNIRAVDDEHPANPADEKDITEQNIHRGLQLGVKQANQTWFPVYNDWAIVRDASGLSRPSRGGVQADKDGSHAGPQGYYLLPLEIKTSVYSSLDQLCNHLGIVLHCLVDNFRVHNNFGRGDSKPGIHVHVGSTDKNGFDLVDMKKLITLAWVCERATFDLHASWRSHSSRYCPSLRRHSRLVELVDPGKVKYHALQPRDRERFPERHKVPHSRHLELSDDQRQLMRQHVVHLERYNGASQRAVETIWAVNDIAHLTWLTSGCLGNRRGALSLHGLCPKGTDLVYTPRKTPLNTIEFRHMQGSMNMEDIISWTKVIRRMMTWALSPQQEYAAMLFNMAIEQQSGDTGFDSTKLIRGIKLDGMQPTPRKQKHHDEEAKPKWRDPRTRK